MGGRGVVGLCALALFMASGCNGSGGGGGVGDAPSVDPQGLVIDGIYNDVGVARGGTLVTLTGAGFDNVISVSFGDNSVADLDLVVEDPYTLQVRTPPYGDLCEGTVDVTVSTSSDSYTFTNGFTYYSEVIEGLSWRNEEQMLQFQWSLSGPGAEIAVFRGAVRIATLSGDATSFPYQEQSMGVYRYTFSLNPSGCTLHSNAVAIVDLGKLVWDPPPELVEGYYVYVAGAANQFPSNENPSFVAGYRTEVRLRELYESGLISGAGVTYFAVASYYRPFISELSTSVSTSYAVVMDEAP